MIESLMLEARLDYPSLTAIAVTRGPGSFTGLRVGLAAAQGLALTLDIPAVGIDSFQAFAALNETGLPAVIVIESRRVERYWQSLDETGLPLTEGACDLPEVIIDHLPRHPFILMGDCELDIEALVAQRSDIQIAPARSGPDPVVLARLAKRQLASGAATAPALPLYIRPPDAKSAQ
jgi:tRNA threonylcarbamoyladenosine biosynthesis protein TsaB